MQTSTIPTTFTSRLAERDAIYAHYFLQRSWIEAALSRLDAELTAALTAEEEKAVYLATAQEKANPTPIEEEEAEAPPMPTKRILTPAEFEALFGE